MALKIVMLIFILILVLTGFYLLARRGKIFIIFDTKKNPEMHYLMSITAYLLFVIAIIGVLIVFLLPKYFNLITLLLAVLVIFIFSNRLNKIN